MGFQLHSEVSFPVYTANSIRDRLITGKTVERILSGAGLSGGASFLPASVLALDPTRYTAVAKVAKWHSPSGGSRDENGEGQERKVLPEKLSVAPIGQGKITRSRV